MGIAHIRMTDARCAPLHGFYFHLYEFKSGRCRNLRFLPEFEAEPQIVSPQNLTIAPHCVIIIKLSP